MNGVALEIAAGVTGTKYILYDPRRRDPFVDWKLHFVCCTSVIPVAASESSRVAPHRVKSQGCSCMDQHGHMCLLHMCRSFDEIPFHQDQPYL